MIVRVHGFDWKIYSERVMPAFSQWLVDGDAGAIYTLYQHTRCAQEDEFLPPVIQHSRIWTRAQQFVSHLPQGDDASREYLTLCSAPQFTLLSDSYIHRHPPQLYQQSDALRCIWGALIEHYCRSWLILPKTETHTETKPAVTSVKEQSPSNFEIASLLHAAGLSELARKVSEQTSLPFSLDEEADDIEGNEDSMSPQGVEIGRHPTILHLRGWLASISIRAMALFELLACGRRYMPFGCNAGEPYENYIGYLTPKEVWQLRQCLHHAVPPEPARAEEDYALFRRQQHASSGDFRIIDEVLPTQGDTFLKVICMAAQYGLGLVCSHD